MANWGQARWGKDRSGGAWYGKGSGSGSVLPFLVPLDEVRHRLVGSGPVR